MSLSVQTRYAQVHPATQQVSLEMALVLGYVILLPYQITAGDYLRIAPSDALVLLALVILPWRLSVRSSAWSVWHVGILLTFAMGSLVTAVRTGELGRYELVNKDVGILLFAAMYVLITTVVDDWQKLRLVLRAFITGTVIQNVVGLIAFLGPYARLPVQPISFLTEYGGARLRGMLVDPNAYGGLLVLAFVLLEASEGGSKPLFGPRWFVFCRITLLMGILFSFSRTAWVSLFLAMLWIVPTRFQSALRGLLVALPLCAIGIWLANEGLSNLVRKMVLRPEQGTGRGELIAAALSRFGDHPIVGGGLGSFIDEQGIIVHNSALWFLADFGLIGITIFAGFMAWFFLKALQARRFCPRSEMAIIYALAVGHIAMLGLAMGIEAFYQRHWWLVMALIGSVCHLTARRNWLAEWKNRSYGNSLWNT